MNKPDLSPFEYGRRAFAKGWPCPPKPPEDEFKSVPCTDAACRWFGWMAARALGYMESKRFREMYEGD